MDYVVRTTPTKPIQASIAAFDLTMRSARFKCLATGALAPPPTCALRAYIAHTVAELALRDGGMGQTLLSTKAPAAYIAAMMLTATDAICNKFRGHSRTDIEYAYKSICTQLAIPHVMAGTPMARVLPSNVHDLTDTDFARTHILSNPRMRV